jgi:hypothetical protein
MREAWGGTRDKAANGPPRVLAQVLAQMLARVLHNDAWQPGGVIGNRPSRCTIIVP